MAALALAGPATCPTAATNPQLSVAVAASKKIGAEHVDATAFAVMFPGHTAPATPKQTQHLYILMIKQLTNKDVEITLRRGGASD